MFARHSLFLVVCVLLVSALVGCSPQSGTDEVGRWLPGDTLAWLHLDEVSAMETALEQAGLLDLLIEELDEPETREDIKENLGIELADDPRETVHAMFQDIRRVDVSAHPPLHAGEVDPAWVFHVDCVDDLAAARIMDMIKPHSDELLTMGAFEMLVVIPDDDHRLFVAQTGAHLVLSDEAEICGAMLGNLIDPPAVSLVDAEEYLLVADSRSHQVRFYMSRAFQSELKGLGGMPPGYNVAAMTPIMDKYGSQTAFVGCDYQITKIVSRQALEPDSPLVPLLDIPAGKSELLAWMPADAFAGEWGLVHEGRQKMELLRQLIVDTMEAAAEVSGETLPPMQADPVTSMEAALGFSLNDAAALVHEWALAGSELGYIMFLRAGDEAGAEELLDMLLACPALAMFPEADPLTVGDATMRQYTWPGQPEVGHYLGRKGDTVMLQLMVKDAVALEAYLGSIGENGLLGNLPGFAAGQLEEEGYGWGFVDVGRLLAAFEQDLDGMLEEVPPALAARLRTLVIAGHALNVGEGRVEMVLEVSGP